MTREEDQTRDWYGEKLGRFVLVLAVFDGDAAAPSALHDWLLDQGCTEEDAAGYVETILRCTKLWNASEFRGDYARSLKNQKLLRGIVD